MLTARETKDALIERLLDSPLVAELERNSSAEAARKRMAAELEALKKKGAASLALLQAEVKAAIAKRDQLRLALDAANVAVNQAGSKVDIAMHSLSRAEAELRRLARE